MEALFAWLGSEYKSQNNVFIIFGDSYSHYNTAKKIPEKVMPFSFSNFCYYASLT